MIQNTLKSAITQALQKFHQVSPADGIKHLLETLGYSTPREVLLDNQTPNEVLEVFGWENFREDKGLLKEWESVNCLFQVTEEEITQNGQGKLFQPSFDTDYLKSYIFLGLTLQKTAYSRGDLAKITREINRQSNIPIMVLFCYGNYVTLSIINRRPNKLDRDKDVLEKITLIKDININSPHRAHIEILADLALPSLPDVQNFDQLHTAWQKVLNTSELNNKFFQEVSNWYFWATQTVTFPDGGEADESIRNATSVIRLITRLIFVWFLKEKGLVPDALFDENQLTNLLKSLSAEESTYYKAILQNLFFATLNTEMNTDEKPDNRKFRGKNQQKGGRDAHYGITNVYRYQDYFTNADEFLRLCSNIPFLNGGLFECLDRDKDDASAPSPKGKEKTKIRIDGFSEREDNVLNVPNVLFFGEATDVDLNQTYGTKNKKYKVQGLINIFNRYKFTIDENTPIEEEIALDPELLGKVFENLLAEYNPETETTARKQTGSFYTPREIVNYMVDESLIAYLQNAVLSQGSSYIELGSNQTNLFGNEYKTGQLSLQTKLENSRFQGREQELESQLRSLLSYSQDSHQFNDDEVDCLINAIDNLKIIDIACGSGAFPMGILQKLVFILGKLDPNNSKWKQQQKEKTIAPILKDIQVVKQISYEQAREEAIQKLQERLAEIEDEFENNEMDYPRKLFLIENCIFGVDIQPIAVQISKLRFFISLIVDQRVNNNQPNRGILPLPNLETKFVAANSLIGLETQLSLRSPEVIQKEEELKQVRQQYFQARTPKTKKKCREKDHILRTEISQLLKSTGLDTATADTLARWNPYDLNTCADFFDPSWMFGVDAFDICIGNPPYVNFKMYSAKDREVYKILYKEIFDGKADLFYYFIVAGTKILQKFGILTYIVSRYWLEAEFANKLRDYISRNTQIYEIIDFENSTIFEGQGIKTSILSLKNTKIKQNTFLYRLCLERENLATMDYENFNNIKIKQSQLIQNSRWQLCDDLSTNLLDKIKLKGVLLSEIADCKQGIITGRDAAFIIEKSFIHNFPQELLKKWIKVGDIHKFSITPVKERFLIYTKDIDRLETFPLIESHFYKFIDKLENRTEVKNGNLRWFDLHRPRESRLFEHEKLICRFKAEFNTFAYDNEQYYSSADTTLVVIRDNFKNKISIKYLLGILNSKLLDFYFKSYAKLMDYRYEYYPKPVSLMIVKEASHKEQEPIIKLVDKILEIKRQNPKADTTELEREIDEIVYKLYGLTAEEIQIIEESVK